MHIGIMFRAYVLLYILPDPPTVFVDLPSLATTLNYLFLIVFSNNAVHN